MKRALADAGGRGGAIRAGREGESTVPESLLHGFHMDLVGIDCGDLSRDQYPRVPGHGRDSASHLWRTDGSPVPDLVSRVGSALTCCVRVCGIPAKVPVRTIVTTRVTSAGLSSPPNLSSALKWAHSSWICHARDTCTASTLLSQKTGEQQAGG